MAGKIDVEAAIADAAQYIVGPDEAEAMLKSLKEKAEYIFPEIQC